MADEKDVEFGNVVWYLDPTSKDVHYGIDGEDNRDYFSYACLKEACALGHPQHLNHYDIWFTKTYQPAVIHSFIKLAKEYKDTFEIKDIEIQETFKVWMKAVLAGRISSDNKDLVCFSCNDHPDADFRLIAHFFHKTGLARENTNFFVNDDYKGTVAEVMGIVKKPILLASRVKAQTELTPMNQAPLPDIQAPQAAPVAPVTPAAPVAPQQEDPEVLKWIEEFKNGDTLAGEKLYNKYEKLIYKIWLGKLKRYGLDRQNPMAEDALSEALVDFLKVLKAYTPAKGMVSTYLSAVVDGIISNHFNPGRNKERVKEISMPTTTERSEGDVETGLDTFKAPEQKEERPIQSITDAVNDILSSSGDKERLQFIFDEFFMKKRTLQDIGDDIGVSKERIRQILNTLVQEIRSKVDPDMLNEKVKLALLFNEVNDQRPTIPAIK